jgi:hypothetical protein
MRLLSIEVAHFQARHESNTLYCSHLIVNFQQQFFSVSHTQFLFPCMKIYITYEHKNKRVAVVDVTSAY